MIENEHIDDRAAGLASLDADDPELIEALAHVRTCERCAHVWEQAQALMSLLDALPAPVPPSPAVLLRTSRAIVSELDHVQRPWMNWAPLVAAATAVAFTFFARHRSVDPLHWWLAAAVVVVSATCTALAQKTRHVAWLAAFATSFALLALAAEGSGALSWQGMHCLLTEIAAALVPYAALTYASAKGHAKCSTSTYAGVAGAGALAGQGALVLTCPASDAGLHVAVFHVGGVLLATLLGTLGGRHVTTVFRS